MVARAAIEHCRDIDDDVIELTRQELDISNRDAVFEALVTYQPEAILNCAAFTDVDGAEAKPEASREANTLGPKYLAEAAKDNQARLVTISTDYVFDGAKTDFYTQEDEPNPQSVYAASKLEGERLAAQVNDRAIIVRTGYIFGRGGANFLCTVVGRAKRGEKLKAISDQYGTPTYAKDLAARLRELAQKATPGIYHVVNSGAGASFEDFTRKAVALVGNTQASVEPVSAAALNRPAKRPLNSRLRCLVSETIGLAQLRNWEAALENFVETELAD